MVRPASPLPTITQYAKGPRCETTTAIKDGTPVWDNYCGPEPKTAAFPATFSIAIGKCTIDPTPNSAISIAFVTLSLLHSSITISAIIHQKVIGCAFLPVLVLDLIQFLNKPSPAHKGAGNRIPLTAFPPPLFGEHSNLTKCS